MSLLLKFPPASCLAALLVSSTIISTVDLLSRLVIEMSRQTVHLERSFDDCKMSPKRSSGVFRRHLMLLYPPFLLYVGP
jgi:hypothetical protein